MKAITKRGKSMAKGLTHGVMDRGTWAIGLTIKSMVKGFILGLMAELMKGLGKIITCMDMGLIHGVTVGSM
jgi:hypothetical protein